MEFRVRCYPLRNDRTMADVIEMPGVVNVNVEPEAAIRGAIKLGLRVLAEKVGTGDLGVENCEFIFDCSKVSSLFMINRKITDSIQNQVSTDVEKDISEQVFNPVDRIFGLGPEALAPESTDLEAKDLLKELIEKGWGKVRGYDDPQILRNSKGEELVFPFSDCDIVEDEIVSYFRKPGWMTGPSFIP